MVKRPAASARACASNPVALLRAMTAALAMGRPASFVTMPSIVAAADWPWSIRGERPVDSSVAATATQTTGVRWRSERRTISEHRRGRVSGAMSGGRVKSYGR